MRTLLIFPPHCLPHQPWSTLPSLKAYLQSHGVEVVQRDLNIEIYHLLLSPEYLAGVTNKLENVLFTLEARLRLSISEQKRFFDTLKTYALSKKTSEEIEEAKNTFRDPERFYNFSNLYRSNEILENAFRMISMAYYPCEITDENFTLYGSYTDFSNLVKATQDTETNPFIEIFDAHVIDSLMECNPQLISISISLQEQILPTLTLSRMLKMRSPEIHVVLGGYVITKIAKRLSTLTEFFNTFADYVVVGEGEKPLLALIQAMEASSDLKTVPSLLFINGDKVQTNPLCDYLDMSDLPTPDYQGLPLKLYLSPSITLSLGSSRGCYWGNCAFCDRGTISGIKYKKRQATKVVDDLEYLSKTYGTQYFTFTDEAISPGSLEEISDEILKRNLRLLLAADVRFDKNFTPELCKKISKAGFIHLRFGLESASDRVLAHMRKGINKKTVTEVLKNFSNSGVCTHLYTFFGYPSESKAEAQQTIDFVVDNSKYISSVGPTTFGLVEDSLVFTYPHRFGIDNIYFDPNRLFKFFYDFECELGMSMSDAKDMEKKFFKELQLAYKDFAIWRHLEWGPKFLYHAKYGHKGLIKVIETKEQSKSKDFSNKGNIDVAFIPRLSYQILYYESQYDIAEIAENVQKGIKKDVECRKSRFLYDSRNYQLLSLNHHAAEIIKLLDGVRNVEQISKFVALRYSTPPFHIQESVISFLNSLWQQDIIFDVRTKITASLGKIR